LCWEVDAGLRESRRIGARSFRYGAKEA
jgi:hypothetical protein